MTAPPLPNRPQERVQLFLDWFTWPNDLLRHTPGLRQRRLLRGTDDSTPPPSNTTAPRLSPRCTTLKSPPASRDGPPRSSTNGPGHDIRSSGRAGSGQTSLLPGRRWDSRCQLRCHHDGDRVLVMTVARRGVAGSVGALSHRHGWVCRQGVALPGRLRMHLVRRGLVVLDCAPRSSVRARRP